MSVRGTMMQATLEQCIRDRVLLWVRMIDAQELIATPIRIERTKDDRFVVTFDGVGLWCYVDQIDMIESEAR